MEKETVRLELVRTVETATALLSGSNLYAVNTRYEVWRDARWDADEDGMRGHGRFPEEVVVISRGEFERLLEDQNKYTQMRAAGRRQAELDQQIASLHRHNVEFIRQMGNAIIESEQ